LFKDLNSEYKELFKDKRLEAGKKEMILERAYSFYKDSDQLSYASTYLTELIKDYQGDKSQGRIKELIGLFEKKGASDVSKVVKMLYLSKYPNDKDVLEKYSKDIEGIGTDFDKYLTSVGESIFASLESTGKLNVKAAKDYVNNCEAYALINPKDKGTPEYIFKAAEVAHTIKSYNKTFELYDWIIEKYPNYSKSATALFLKGYIFDNELKKYDEATKLYNEFLEKYPNSDLVDDVQTLKEFMGKSDEEILKLIEANQKEKK
jgi:tetratricopeptide (TPR) repeat protein